MTPQDALLYMTIIGGVGTVINLWITLYIRATILGLKLWTTEGFVGKADLPQYLQFAESKARVIRTGHDH